MTAGTIWFRSSARFSTSTARNTYPHRPQTCPNAKEGTPIRRTFYPFCSVICSTRSYNPSTSSPRAFSISLEQ